MKRRCAFCADRARWSYNGVRFCYWHMTHFYLGLHLELAHD